MPMPACQIIGDVGHKDRAAPFSAMTAAPDDSSSALASRPCHLRRRQALNRDRLFTVPIPDDGDHFIDVEISAAPSRLSPDHPGQRLWLPAVLFK